MYTTYILSQSVFYNFKNYVKNAYVILYELSLYYNQVLLVIEIKTNSTVKGTLHV